MKVSLSTVAEFRDKNSPTLRTRISPGLRKTEDVIFLQVRFSLVSLFFSLFVALQLCLKELDIKNLKVSLK